MFHSKRLGFVTHVMCPIVMLFWGSLATLDAAELPINKRISIVSEALNPPQTRILQLQIDPNVPKLGNPNFGEDNSTWMIQPVGLPGKVKIINVSNNLLLESESVANDDQPAAVKLSAATSGAMPTTAQQWRILEVDTGAFLIQNVQTERLLEADVTNLNPLAPSGTIMCLGRNGNNKLNRQWRFFTDRVEFLDGSLNGVDAIPLPVGSMTGELFTPPITVPANPVGTEDFAGAVKLTITVDIIGNGTNEISAKVTMKAVDNNMMTIEGSKTYSLKKAPVGKKIFLPVDAPTTETLTFTDTDETDDIIVSNAAMTADEVAVAPTYDKTNLNLQLINHCVVVGKAAGPDAGKTGVTVHLIPLQYMIDVP